MADLSKNVSKAGQELQKLTECCICFKEFTDPRMLPCIHTFCLECLKQTGDAVKKRPRENMPCPLCRKVFVIPAEGMNGLQKNFFMQHLMDVTALKQDQKPVTDCDICKALHEGDEEKIKEATMRCLECEENFCDMCSKTHKLHKLSKAHNMVKIGVNTDEDLRKCVDHSQKPLDYYCVGCEREVCVSCLHVNHASHKCTKLTTMEVKFRQMIEENRLKISSYAKGILLKAETMERRKTEFHHKAEKIEFEIQRRNQELLEIIDKHTKSLLEELSVIKRKRIKEFEKEKKEIECFHTILKGFDAYSTELHSRGSSNDVSSCISAMLKRANELEKEHETFFVRSCLSAELSFEITDLEIYLAANSNVVGLIKDSASYFENNLVIVGLSTDGCCMTNDVVKINLHRPNEVSNMFFHYLPSMMINEVGAAIHDNTMYLTGIGFTWNEIWKYKSASGWVHCASLIQRRRGHCTAFVDGVLYICGGFDESIQSQIFRMMKGDANVSMDVLDSVETYDVVANNCTTVGKLVHGINSSGNCVPFKNSLYIFGGKDKYSEAVSRVQVYNTKHNTCTLLSKRMPRGYHLMRAALWKTSVVLLGCDTCFIFN